jgi:5-epi-alpha-selinene synthase
MSPFLQPALFEPHAAPINRYADLVEREGIAWVLRFFPAVALSPGRLRKLQAAKFARLAARGLPRAPLAELRLVCDWITWLFFYDDALCDDVASAADPLSRLHDAQERMLAVMRGEPPEREDGPLVHMLADLATRTAAWAAQGFMPRFTGEVERYFQSNVWELHNHLHQVRPPLPIYLKMRPFTGAACVIFGLIELTRHTPLAAARRHVMLEQLELLANNAICWANDIGSLEKEMLEHNPHNLVLVLRAEGLDMDEALARAVAMQQAEEDAFEALAAGVRLCPQLASPEVLAYVADLGSFVRGNAVWMQETMRYRARLSMRSYGEAA